jgi:hypothetical protein
VEDFGFHYLFFEKKIIPTTVFCPSLTKHVFMMGDAYSSLLPDPISGMFARTR